MYTVCTNPVEGCWVPTVHTNCSHNEIAALLKRSLAPTTLAGPSERLPVIRVFASLARIARSWGGCKWSHLETAESYTGLLRRRYLEAEASLRVDGPVRGQDTILKAFLKAEKFGYRKYGKPRMIFPRSPRYNLALASYLKPFEHWLWGYLTGRRLFGGSNTRVVAKGLNAVQRAGLINRKFKSFANCVCFEVDGSTFEAHVDTWQLQKEFSVYLAAHGGDPDLQALLDRQLVNRGYTSNGVRFSREGGRASGDFNTGMGNSLIMLAVVVAVLKHLKVRFDVLVDGDNALVFLSEEVSSRVRACFAPLATRFSGHEMVLERPVRRLEEVRFGQSAPVEIATGKWTMVRDWIKVVSQMTSNHAHINEPRFALPYLRGVAMCELALNAGVPVVQTLARTILEQTEGVKAVDASFYRDYEALGVEIGKLRADRFKEPTAVARTSFEAAFGVEPERQLLMERELSKLVVQEPTWFPEYSPWETHLLDSRPGLVDKFFGVPV